jgi:hypothetical protein
VPLSRAELRRDVDKSIVELINELKGIDDRGFAERFELMSIDVAYSVKLDFDYWLRRSIEPSRRFVDMGEDWSGTRKLPVKASHCFDPDSGSLPDKQSRKVDGHSDLVRFLDPRNPVHRPNVLKPDPCLTKHLGGRIDCGEFPARAFTRE